MPEEFSNIPDFKHDIQTRKDIDLIINVFYEKVRNDEKISFFFRDIIAVDWDTHLPRIGDFWENILFGTVDFRGNPIAKHLEINQKSPLNAEHFQRWIDLFSETVGELYKGANADIIVQRAMSISSVMQIKIHQTKQ